MFNEIEQHRQALLRYIESAYHLTDETLLQKREALLNAEETIAQRPYLESAAKYKPGRTFAELEIPADIAAAFTSLCKSRLLFNPPYQHQADALESVLTHHKNIIVTTGTGSGKTECFLLPILGRLLAESPKPSFQQRAVRALLLYPMNALVNDQLGRLRRLFASEQCMKLFKAKSNRPVKFGRYTGRTLFPGRVPAEDKNFAANMNKKLAGLQFFYNLADRSLNHEDEKERKQADKVLRHLVEKGKFPAKYSSPDQAAQGFIQWHGSTGNRWLVNGQLARTVERQDDAELLLRHEMQHNPPDILVTNYSMLEYMLLRPIERKIFTKTKAYFEDNPSERFILVLDESHLYNGAQGTEIAMLIRRLKHRLHLRSEQLQVICTSASFGESGSACKFASDLSGVPLDSVKVISSEDKKVPQQPSGAGTKDDADWLMNCNINDIRKNETERQAVSEKLQTLPVFGRLANLTSLTIAEEDELTAKNEEAPQEIESLAKKLFGSIANAEDATDKLVELASLAKDQSGNPLFAARVHRFYRGLPGLWKCSDPNCGELYASPQRNCNVCGHRVFELHSCKKCGTAFFYAYTNDADNPQYLWAEDCGKVDNVQGAVTPIHILLREPSTFDNKKHQGRYLNFITGVLSDSPLEGKTIPVWIPTIDKERKRLFAQCPVCKARGTSIGNQKTKGDMPFQQMIASQLLEQPEQPQSETPLKGRKVLIFSDGRQAASRLAGKLTTDSMRDVIRPLVIAGYQYLQEKFKNEPETQSLRYVYPALLAGAFHHNLTLSPVLKAGEQFHEHFRKVRENLNRQDITWTTFRKNIESFNNISESVLKGIYETLFNEHSGYHAIALVRITIADDSDEYNSDDWKDLPIPENIAQDDAEQWKRHLVDLWIQLMMSKKAVRLRGTPDSWIDDDSKRFPKRDGGGFITVLESVLQNKPFVKKNFSSAKNNTPKWLKYFRNHFGCDETANGLFLDGNHLVFQAGDSTEWLRCNVCTAIFPYNPLAEDYCPFCQSSRSIERTDPKDMTTSKRIQVYRAATDRMKIEGVVPLSFIAKEHTAAIGTIANNEDAFTQAEKYEMRFQDITLPDETDNEANIPVDVLSCTTTMEVGIDIGSLTAVAMRNVPPNRSNYQQRAGRAGRRGASLSTLLTYADQDSHNQQYFTQPAEMIGGPVKNPILNIDNEQIVKRHLFALIFSMFQQERIQDACDPNVFSSLGSVNDFRSGGVNDFSYNGLEQWLNTQRQTIVAALQTVLAGNDAFSQAWIESIPRLLLEELKKKKLDMQTTSSDAESENTDNESVESEHAPLDVSKLLDRLFDESLLPSYAFPNDCVAMHVFDKDESKRQYKPVMRYAPQYGLTQALSSYAPGKEVYIDGKRYFSFAIWSPFPDKRHEAWEHRKLYYECSCGHVEMKDFDENNIGEILECPGCKQKTLGPARVWFIPPGFAQPIDMPEELPEFDVPDSTFATHAKLTANFDNHSSAYSDSRFTIWKGKEKLILTNRGVSEEKLSGFHYCEKCGRIEPANWFSDRHADYSMFATDEGGQTKYHNKPYPVGFKEKTVCPTKWTERNVMLGTTFNSDVVLIRLHFGKEINLLPDSYLTRMALGTLATAMSQTASAELEIDPNNIGGEFRPAATPNGQNGKEADIFLYDNVADGAGFVQAATKEPLLFFQQVLHRLENCDCESACPRCLQTYQNRYMHGSLDRKLAAGLLRYLLDNTMPLLDDGTENRLLKILAEDLLDKNVRVEIKNGYLEVGGKSVIVVHSLTGEPATERTKRLKNTLSNVIRIDHVTIDRALPAATKSILENCQ